MDSQSPSQLNRVDDLINRRRNESDARDIIKEVERLATFEGEHKYRWIWELLQNARDEAGNGVEIEFQIEDGRFVFKHNGKPFFTDHLIALTLRSSTKPLNGIDGNAGKFGTGFVTTHLLNKCVKIEGVHENDKGKRRFIHKLDRSSADLEVMMSNLAVSIQNIRDIDNTPESNNINDLWTSFEYELNPSSLEIAQGGINQLEINLAFTLLINENKIHTVKISNEGDVYTLTLDKKENVLDGLNFARLANDRKTQQNIGLLYQQYGELIIAIPAEVLGGIYYLNAIGSSAHLFKELPLVGTEDFVIPNIIQHKKFLPAEPRDGVRTKCTDKTEDLVAITNREAFKNYLDAFPSFVWKLINGSVKNSHLIADIGLPKNPDVYYDRNWLKTELHDKLREEILKHKLVMTVSGNPVLVGEAYFPDCPDEYLNIYHSLLSKIFPEKTPDKDSYHDWRRIISQERDSWPDEILIGITELVKKTADIEVLVQQLKTPERINEWLQELVTYLEFSNNERLGNEYPIYPNQLGALCQQDNIFHEVSLHNRFKTISFGLGRDLNSELLPLGFKAKFVKDFNIKEFLDAINSTIGTLKIELATETQQQAIISICCIFEATRAPRREIWFDLLSRLLPNKTEEKVTIVLDANYSWDTAEKWTLKMVSLLIHSAQNITQFTSKYFNNDELALIWLKDFLSFVFRNEENKTALEYSIILTQDGVFKKYTDDLYREDKHEDFLILLKEIFKSINGFRDPASFLIHNKINNSELRSTGISILTRPIDDIFNDRATEDKVKEGLEYHEVFMALKELTESEYWAKLFPIFYEKQPVLFIKAFGAGSSVSRLLRIRKPVEEMEKLAALSLSAEQLKELDDAAKLIGNSQSLIEKAKQMAEAAEEIRWRQSVGDAAEKAFLDALADAHPSFTQPENPDNGKDFIIRIGNLHYSIEIKSAVEQKETVKMSLRQGEDASKEPDIYALCVISRPFGTLTTKEQFIQDAKFVTDIGMQIGNKVDKFKEGLALIQTNDNINIELDNKTGYVSIKKAIWTNGINFNDFITNLKDHFKLLNS